MKPKLIKLLGVIAVISMFAAPVGAQPLAGAPQAPDAAAPHPAPSRESADAGDVSIYIVQLNDAPLAMYEGGIAGLPATNPAANGLKKIDLKSDATEAYLSYLEGAQAQFLADMESLAGRSIDVRFSYKHAFNGLALELTKNEAKAAAAMAGVRMVQKDFMRYPTTDVGPQWIGADNIWDGTATGGLPGTMGEGVTVGVIDTGINLDHESFAEVGPVDGYVHTNPLGSGNFLGLCNSDPGTWVCNDKLIGYYIMTGESTEDTDGHGSHTSSTAAGNIVTATLNISVTNPYTYTAQIAGVAPHANIIHYDGCLDGGGCPGSALVMAINQTVADGVVDVINYSIGGGTSDPWNDADSQAFLGTVAAGIVPVTSAGNSGPDPSTVGSPGDSPWLLTVGASTHNRAFPNSIQNMSGGTSPPADAQGKGITITYGPANMVYAGDFGDALCLNPFAANTWTNGEIVVCDRGTNARVQKGVNVLSGGAGGMVLANVDPGQSVNSDPHILPAVHVSSAHGDAIRTWLSSGSGHTGTISGAAVDLSPANGDVMAGFSSRGPLINTASDIIKPDVTNPGVDILAAYRTGSGPPGNVEPWMDEYNVVSGTSMSSPHTAGSAALVVALHPDWTPAEVKSALMSTAKTSGVLKEDGTTPADPFDMGAGRVDLNYAGQTGLVLDETAADFTAANPTMGGDPRTLNLASMADDDCVTTCSWTRVLNNTQNTATTWTASTSAGGGMIVSVDPVTFTVAANASVTLTVTADVSGATSGIWNFGEVLLTPQTPQAGFTIFMPLVPRNDATPRAPSLSGGSPAVRPGGLPVVHLPVATFVTPPPPDIEVSPDSITSTQDSGVMTTMPLTITNNGGSDLTWSIFEENTTPPRAGGSWSENWDSYATGQNMHGVGGWKGWGNDSQFTAFTTSAQAQSTPNSIDITTDADLVHEYSGYDSGVWEYKTSLYVPTGFSGESYFILLNQYDDAGASNNWSTQVHFQSGTDLVIADGVGSGNMLPLLYDQWVDIEVIIDLNADLQSFYYGGALLYSGSWSDGVSGGGITEIGAVDLFANGASSVYYDDLSLQMATGDCVAVSDIAWASVSPNNGTTSGGSDSVLSVEFDSSGLSSGDYTGNLCVTSNDPVTPLVSVPVTMTVTSGPPVIEVSPIALIDTQPRNTIMTTTLVISNTGESNLNWTLTEAAGRTESLALPPATAPPAPVVSSAAQCSLYENYPGAEPQGYAEHCLGGIAPQAGAADVLEGPTDTGFAQDIGFVSDNFVSFTLNDFPGQTVLGTNVMALFGYDFDPSASTLYALDDTSQSLGTINLATGAFTSIGASVPLAGHTWTGLTSDPTTGTFYASSTDGTTGALYTINIATGTATLVGTNATTALLIDISVGPDGVMYGHDIGTDSIYTIDKSNGAATLVGLTGYNANFAQGMDFDNDDGTLYIFLYIGGGANVYGTVNTSTGAVTPLATDNPLGEFEGAIQTTGSVAPTCTPSDIPWLFLSDTSGTTGMGASDTISVTYNTLGVNTGVYTGTICVNSNDPVTPQVQVPVTLTVTSMLTPPVSPDAGGGGTGAAPQDALGSAFATLAALPSLEDIQ
ncbi:MAG: S8 family serine peptidase [Anaerolineales bacterium]|nr:S8 family serine peptidase [Anaerolineales bacterium]